MPGPLHPIAPAPSLDQPGNPTPAFNDTGAHRRFQAEKASQERAAEQLGRRIADNATGAVPRPLGS